MNILHFVLFVLCQVFALNIMALEEKFVIPTQAELVELANNKSIALSREGNLIKAAFGYKLVYSLTETLKKIEKKNTSIIELPGKIIDFNSTFQNNYKVLSLNKRILGSQVYIDIIFKEGVTKEQAKEILSFPINHGWMNVKIDCDPSYSSICGKMFKHVIVYNQYKFLDEESNLYRDTFYLSLLNDFKNRIELSVAVDYFKGINLNDYARNRLFDINMTCRKNLSPLDLLVCQILLKENVTQYQLQDSIDLIQRKIVDNDALLKKNSCSEIFDQEKCPDEIHPRVEALAREPKEDKISFNDDVRPSLSLPSWCRDSQPIAYFPSGCDFKEIYKAMRRQRN